MNKIILLIILLFFLAIILPTPDFLGHASTLWLCYVRRIIGIFCALCGFILSFYLLRNYRNKK